MKSKKTTIYCNTADLKNLTKIADKYNRTVIGQIRHWIAEDKK